MTCHLKKYFVSSHPFTPWPASYLKWCLRLWGKNIPYCWWSTQRSTQSHRLFAHGKFTMLVNFPCAKRNLRDNTIPRSWLTDLCTATALTHYYKKKTGMAPTFIKKYYNFWLAIRPLSLILWTVTLTSENYST